jgi:uncharacterized membrane protein
MRPMIGPSLLLSLLLLILLPIVFGPVMLGALGRLHVSPQAAGAIMVAIVVGGFVNIPVKRIVRHDNVVVHPLAPSIGMISIGGAGTFDGIVLSGIIATYLA